MADRQDGFTLNHVITNPAFWAMLKRLDWTTETIMAGRWMNAPQGFSGGRYLAVEPDDRSEHGWRIMWVETT